MGKNYLEGLEVSVSGEDTHYVVTYMDGTNVGECVYEMVKLTGKNKPIRQRVFVMTSSKMGEIISGIHQRSPLSENDMENLSMEIREYSLIHLNKYLNEE